ncbi:MAG: hypothetical protein IPQ06_11125 [Chitinophagaceae bacterium]|nr:hypothetical protein [Chitinophagaceae bacterium]
MPQSNVYFDNQKTVISQHLHGAKTSIIIAIAWFTDKNLFDILVKKSKEGVHVYVLIHDDEINSTSDITYEELNSLNSDVVLIGDEKKLMHHKFCVIDGITILHGSYNWTYQAMNNHETLIVTEGDIELSATFVKQFYKIRKSYRPQSPIDRSKYFA